MLLKNFCDDDGRLWVHRSGSKKPFSTAPSNVFGETHLYRGVLADGSADLELETAFSQLEGKAAPLLESIIRLARREVPYSFTLFERATLNVFVYLQMKRVPEMQTKGSMAGEAERLFDNAIEKALAEFPDRQAEILELVSEEERLRLIKNAKLNAIGSLSDKVLRAIELRGVSIVVITKPTRRKFIIGSDPVVRWGIGGLDNPDHELWLPIASDVAISFRQQNPHPLLYSIEDADRVRSLNLAVAERSGMIAGASRELLVSIRRPR